MNTLNTTRRSHSFAGFVFAATLTVAMLAGIGHLASVDTSTALPQLAQSAASQPKV